MTTEELAKQRVAMRVHIETDIERCAQDLAVQRGVPLDEKLRAEVRSNFWSVMPTSTRVFIETGKPPDFAN